MTKLQAFEAARILHNAATRTEDNDALYILIHAESQVMDMLCDSRIAAELRRMVIAQQTI